jgi:DNA topoisomerase III
MPKKRVLHVAEKPSVAKGISGILGGGSARRRAGKSKYNPIYEFEYTLEGQRCDNVVTSVSGHLMEIDTPASHRGWRSCDPVELFDVELVKDVRKDMDLIAKNLQVEARRCHWLVLWLDCDREGENIAFEVVQVCSRANSNLRVLRAHFSAIIARDIHEACRTLTPPNQLDSDAVDARMEIDLRIGACFTRWQTLRLQARFDGVGDMPISYGPCQFPTLGFVVERYLKAEAFVPESFWLIAVHYSNGDHGGASSSSSSSSSSLPPSSCKFTWHRGRLFDRLACIVLYERCLEQPQATVVDVQKKRKSKWKPLPLTTVALQKLASRKLRMSSKRTMEVAERLYQQGIISYPRTETDQFPPNLDLRALIAEHRGDGKWGAFAERLLSDPNAFGAPRLGKNNDNSHPPIHPTKHVDSLSGDDGKLYEMVVRHFLACCSRDAVGAETLVEIDVRGEQFSARGLMVEERNYLEVYIYERWAQNELPVFAVGQQFVPSSIDMRDGETSQPPMLTEADLISLMDRHGIGTDATIAQHIQTIQERLYAVKQGNVFVPTTLGIALYEGYAAVGFNRYQQLAKPHLRAAMETDMKKISAGTRAKHDVLADNLAMYRALFLRVRAVAARTLDLAFARRFEPSTATLVAADFSTCGRCEHSMQLVELANSAQLRCTHCVANNNAEANDGGGGMYELPNSAGGDIEPRQHRCPLCNFQVVEVVSRNGKPYSVCPYCYSNPPTDAPDAPSRMACFACAADCPLAGKRNQPQTPIIHCPDCATPTMRVVGLRDNASKYMLGCSNYPQCRLSLSLPGSIATIELGEPCTRCTHMPTPPLRLNIRWSHRLSNMATSHYTICVGGCDSLSNTILASCNERHLSKFHRKPPTSTSSVSSRGTRGTRGISGASSRGTRGTSSARGPSTRGTNNTRGRGTTTTNDMLNLSFQKLTAGLSDDGSTAPMCCHRKACAPRTSGAGRDFWTCDDADRCSTFYWADELEQVLPPGAAAVPNCNGHSEPCSLRTVQKEGNNQGRKFWACARSKQDQCQTFNWVDELSSSSSSSSTSSSSSSSSTSTSTTECYNCHERGHWSRDCPQKKRR